MSWLSVLIGGALGWWAWSRLSQRHPRRRLPAGGAALAWETGFVGPTVPEDVESFYLQVEEAEDNLRHAEAAQDLEFANEAYELAVEALGTAERGLIDEGRRRYAEQVANEAHELRMQLLLEG